MEITDTNAMTLALAQAKEATDHGDVPVGALVVIDGVVISQAHNERELRHDPTAHAEILALRRASQVTGQWRLEQATLVVTLEPCAMCAGAAVSARIKRVVFGTDDPKAGALGSLYNLGADPRLNHEFAVVGGIEAEACAKVLTDFFADKR